MNYITKPIPSLPGYFANSDGSIITIRGRKTFGHQITKNGALGIYISPRKQLPVAKLICEAFHGTPNVQNAIAIHIDGCRSNNTPDNLTWGTHKDRVRIAQARNDFNPNYAEGLSRMHEVNKKKVRIIESDEMCESQVSCAKKLGVNKAAVQYAIKYGGACKGVHLKNC